MHATIVFGTKFVRVKARKMRSEVAGVDADASRMWAVAVVEVMKAAHNHSGPRRKLRRLRPQWPRPMPQLRVTDFINLVPNTIEQQERGASPLHPRMLIKL